MHSTITGKVYTSVNPIELGTHISKLELVLQRLRVGTHFTGLLKKLILPGFVSEHDFAGC